MRQRERERSAGQVSGEYAIVLGAIALVCMVALFAIGIAVRGQLGSPDPGATPQQPFTPPAHPAPTRVPTTIEECEHDGWRTFGFRSEADCKDSSWYDGAYLRADWQGKIARSTNGTSFSTVYNDDQKNTLYQSRAIAAGYVAPK